MGEKVLPLSLCLLLCLLSPSTCLHDGRTARRLDFKTKSFLLPSSDLTNFPLSDFSPAVNNYVNTYFSVQALEDLPPIDGAKSPHEKNPLGSTTSSYVPKHKLAQPSPNSSAFLANTRTASTPTSVPSSKVIKNHSDFPALFDPFKKFFDFPIFSKAKKSQTTITTESTSSRAFTTLVTKPQTTKVVRISKTTQRNTSSTTKITKLSTTTASTISTTTKTSTPPVEANILNKNQVFKFYKSISDGDTYDDKISDGKDDSKANTDKDDNQQSDFHSSYSCPGSLRECLTACSPVISINQVAYKLCVNECLDRCQ